MSKRAAFVGSLPARKRAMVLIGVALSVLVIIGVSAGYARVHTHANPVPRYIADSVDFPIYYPIPQKLPEGYKLDPGSFKHPLQNGVTYAVINSENQKLIFSLQPKPSNSDLDNFTSSYIPLHNTYRTPNGLALLGAYNTKGGTETFVSLPTNSTTWIIVTAPYNIDQTQLKQVLASLTS